MYNLLSAVAGTLLNKLFGTTFNVMDETRRQQTTKGKFLCKYFFCIFANSSFRYLDVQRE